MMSLNGGLKRLAQICRDWKLRVAVKNRGNVALSNEPSALRALRIFASLRESELARPGTAKPAMKKDRSAARKSRQPKNRKTDPYKLSHQSP